MFLFFVFAALWFDRAGLAILHHGVAATAVVEIAGVFSGEGSDAAFRVVGGEGAGGVGDDGGVVGVAVVIGGSATGHRG